MIFTGVLAVLGLESCSTLETTAKPAPTVTPPEYVKVPHPAGYDMGDITALFSAPNAPSRESNKDCNTLVHLSRKTIRNDDEFKEAVGELVHQNPIAYHWCYYGKLLELESQLRTEPFIDERQRIVLQTYSFLVPVAQAFIAEFHDSRYLRWAIRHYRRLSPRIFFQQVEQTPKMTNELVEVANPFGLWREPPEMGKKSSVLEKYHLGKPQQNQPEESSELLKKLMDKEPEPTAPIQNETARTSTPEFLPAAQAPVPQTVAVPTDATSLPTANSGAAAPILPVIERTPASETAPTSNLTPNPVEPKTASTPLPSQADTEKPQTP
jgi:hypothetical protein